MLESCRDRQFFRKSSCERPRSSARFFANQTTGETAECPYDRSYIGLPWYRYEGAWEEAFEARPPGFDAELDQLSLYQEWRIDPNAQQ